MGRPKLDAEDLQTSRIEFKLKASEKAELQAMADAKDMTLKDFLMSKAFSRPVRTFVVTKVVNQLSECGRTLKEFGRLNDDPAIRQQTLAVLATLEQRLWETGKLIAQEKQDSTD